MNKPGYVINPELAIPPDHVKSTCKPGAGASCCRYLVLGGAGFECLKNTPNQEFLDNKVNDMVAQGDNCEGITFLKALPKTNPNLQ